jgi:hypothetical protein
VANTYVRFREEEGEYVPIGYGLELSAKEAVALVDHIGGQPADEALGNVYNSLLDVVRDVKA